MTLKKRILALLAAETLDDDELAARLGVVRQQVNQTCRAMEYERLVTRERGPAGKIVNRLTEAGALLPPPRSRSSTPSTRGTPITEDDVKGAVSDWLEAKGFTRLLGAPPRIGLSAPSVIWWPLLCAPRVDWSPCSAGPTARTGPIPVRTSS